MSTASCHETRNATSSSVFRILRGIERLPAGATGALHFGVGERRQGTVLVENGQICWASATAMERRLTDILKEQAELPISDEIVEQTYEHCRKDGTPLGEALVSRGIVLPDELRRALRQHIAEALNCLGALRELAPQWRANRRQRYDARFSFTPASLLACVGALAEPALASRASKRLRSLAEVGRVSMALPSAATAVPQLPFAESRGERIGVDGLLRLCVEGLALVGVYEKDELENNVVAATTGSGAGLIVWRYDYIVYVVLSERPEDLGILLATRARAQSR